MHLDDGAGAVARPRPRQPGGDVVLGEHLHGALRRTVPLLDDHDPPTRARGGRRCLAPRPRCLRGTAPPRSAPTARDSTAPASASTPALDHLAQRVPERLRGVRTVPAVLEGDAERADPPPGLALGEGGGAHVGQRAQRGRTEVHRRLAAGRGRGPARARGTPRWWRPGRGPGCVPARGRAPARGCARGSRSTSSSISSTSAGVSDSMPSTAMPCGQLVGDLGELGVLLARAPRRGDGPRSVSSSSRHGGAHSRSTLSRVRWSATAKVRISSTSSPKNSTRSGCSSVGGNTSTMPPRTANSPRFSTRSTREYAASASRRTTSSRSTS